MDSSINFDDSISSHNIRLENCLVCGSTIVEDSLDYTMTAVDVPFYLKSICDVVGLSESETDMMLVKHENLVRRINFCVKCRLNLETFRDIQSQLQSLTVQISQIKEILSVDLCGQASPGVEDPVFHLRTCLKNEYDLRLNSAAIKPESILGDVLVSSNHFDSPSPLDMNEFPTDDDHSIPTPNIADWKLKPCQVNVVRVEDDDCRKFDFEDESTRRKRLRKLLKRQGAKLYKGANRRRRKDKDIKPVVRIPQSFPPRPSANRSKRRRIDHCPMDGCDERFISELHVGYHIRQVHEGVERPFNCIACEAEYENFTDLRKHIRENHERQQNPEHNTVGKRSKVVDCPKCKRGFPGYHELVMHFRRQGGLCSKDPLPLNSTLDRTRKAVNKYKCGGCDKFFKTPYFLNIHVKANHLGVHPFLCEFCCKPFKRELSLKTHQRFLHPVQYKEAFNVDEQSFLDDLKNRHCGICNKTFVNEQGKKNHDSIHTQQYKFYCPTCGAGYTNKRNLQHHEVTHTDVKEFECTQCPLRFNRGDKLRRHIERVHPGDERKKEFTCEFCEKAFWDNFALQRHKRIMHRDAIPQEQAPEFGCELCGYTCPDKGYLGIHLKTKRHKEKAAQAQATLEFQTQVVVVTSV